ncbi:MAG: GatB/YqeY domain-containing protein [Alphaproteobacteria bacterium]|nr:GatB/YqeY domain-containing protein [Alphaproteobacteria bacterium]
MLRQKLNEALKAAMRAKDERRVSTTRLILAALKDRDIAARGDGRPDGITDDEILVLLQMMVRQRRESIELYEKGGRSELADQEREEIAIIEEYLPRQLSENEVADAAKQLVAEVGAKGIKDMGKVMAQLKARYAGQLDLAKASAIVKNILGAAA